MTRRSPLPTIIGVKRPADVKWRRGFHKPKSQRRDDARLEQLPPSPTIEPRRPRFLRRTGPALGVLPVQTHAPAFDKVPPTEEYVDIREEKEKSMNSSNEERIDVSVQEWETVCISDNTPINVVDNSIVVDGRLPLQTTALRGQLFELSHYVDDTADKTVLGTLEVASLPERPSCSLFGAATTGETRTDITSVPNMPLKQPLRGDTIAEEITEDGAEAMTSSFDHTVTGADVIDVTKQGHHEDGAAAEYEVIDEDAISGTKCRDATLINNVNRLVVGDGRGDIAGVSEEINPSLAEFFNSLVRHFAAGANAMDVPSEGHHEYQAAVEFQVIDENVIEDRQGDVVCVSEEVPAGADAMDVAEKEYHECNAVEELEVIDGDTISIGNNSASTNVVDLLAPLRSTSASPDETLSPAAEGYTADSIEYRRLLREIVSQSMGRAEAPLVVPPTELKIVPVTPLVNRVVPQTSGAEPSTESKGYPITPWAPYLQADEESPVNLSAHQTSLDSNFQGSIWGMQDMQNSHPQILRQSRARRIRPMSAIDLVVLDRITHIGVQSSFSANQAPSTNFTNANRPHDNHIPPSESPNAFHQHRVQHLPSPYEIEHESTPGCHSDASWSQYNHLPPQLQAPSELPNAFHQSVLPHATCRQSYESTPSQIPGGPTYEPPPDINMQTGFSTSESIADQAYQHPEQSMYSGPDNLGVAIDEQSLQLSLRLDNAQHVSPPPCSPSGGNGAIHGVVDEGYQVGTDHTGISPTLGSLVNFVSERFDRLDVVLQESTLRYQTEVTALRDDVAAYAGGLTFSSKKRAKPKSEDPRDRDEFRVHFLAKLRSHFLHLLKIPNNASLHTIKPPTNVEIRAFNQRLPGCIRITPENWTYDFSRSPDEAFNLEAMDIFAGDFLRRLGDGWYAESNPSPDRFKDLSYIKQSFKLQLKYLYRLYKVQNSPDRKAVSNRRLRRKRQLYRVRLNALCRDPDLKAHRWLFEKAGIDGVSSDESDGELPNKLYQRVQPAWRPQQLANLQYKADFSAARLRAPTVGRSKNLGSKPRRRVDSTKYNSEAIAPPNLPKNCYDNQWLNALRPSELSKLNVSNYLYDYDAGRQNVSQ